MMHKVNKVPIVILLLGLGFSSVSYAQQITTKDGVFTQAQAAAGQVAYDDACKACHDMSFYNDIWEAWEGKPLSNFWNIIVAEMPSDNPGSLYDAEYTDAVAYILSSMGFPAGEKVLDVNNGMDQIVIVSP